MVRGVIIWAPNKAPLWIIIIFKVLIMQTVVVLTLYILVCLQQSD